MSGSVRRRLSAWVVVSAVVAFGASLSLAFQIRQQASRFDALVIVDPSKSLDGSTASVESLPAGSPHRNGWDAFRAANKDRWSVHLDRRSGAPMLVEGRGIALVPGRGNSLQASAPVTLDSLEPLIRNFLTGNRVLLKADNAELILNREASGRFGDDVWQVVFDRRVRGVPVQGDRYLFAIKHGNLVQFGASRWSRITTSPVPDIDARAALDRMFAYMGVGATDGVKVLDGGSLRFVPLPAAAGFSPNGTYSGAIGNGYGAALAWRVAVAVAGEPGSWVGLIDAHTGNVIAFYDEIQYAQVKGGVYPGSNDGIVPDGVEQPGYPMPYANVTIGANTTYTGSVGAFDCTPESATATTTLNGQYVRVVDTCGPISVSTTCGADLDLAGGPGTDCAVPPGSSAGNTHAARSSFYHLNRIAEHARAWLPGNAWLSAQLTNNVNLNQTCNAYWLPANGTVNFFKSGGGCANTGELAGVFLHEWGHGFDDNDGGGSDNPGEAYADVTAMLATHLSCVGRGFEPGVNCSGYGNACLNCTGIRDQDWDQHANHAPTTPTVLAALCDGGDGPCGREGHCEGHLAGETIWDLATRDLPASGLDAATSWQLTDKLWYKSRAGSGGNAYTCSGTTSDGCSATSWFSKMRVQDDDDGNLANGTPHAAAIFAAFDRHKIACGLAGDPSNQNSTTCPALPAPTLTATPGSSSVGLGWTAVANASSYRILRNDQGCDAGFTIVATVAAPATNYTDTGLANAFAEYYRVQAVGANTACDGALSACKPATPQPLAGTIKFANTQYSCSSTIAINVTDANIPGTTTTVTLASNSEPGGEIVTLTQTPLGSSIYLGSIATTAGPAGSDGLLSVAHGDTITGTYIDANDGQGGINVPRNTSAGADCVSPIISNVATSNITGQSARITWTTNEDADSVVRYGLAPPPPGSTASSATRVLSHSVDVTGLAECSNYVYSVQSSDVVGNSASDDNAGAHYAFATFANTAPSYTSTDTPVAIPDNNPTGITSTINVPDAKIVTDVNVKVNITHPFDGDVTIYLMTPNNIPITLSNQHGSLGDDYTDTVFDDEATTPIATGTAPFTGSFIPDAPLSAADGISSAGAWRLKVVDAGAEDAGTIDNWTLSLTHPVQFCGSHASFQSHLLLGDTCSPGGGGGGNGVWEAGENVQFKIRVKADGQTGLTGLTATITPLTPGVTMVDDTAGFASLAAGASADSIAPHFTAHLPTTLACDSTISFQVTIQANEGTWSGSFSQIIGHKPGINSIVLNESFTGGIPATWSRVDGGSGGGLASTWTTGNPGGRTFAAPMVAPVAIVDSDTAGGSATQDEQLITPVLNLATATAVTLEFDQYYRYWSLGLVEKGDVDVRSSATGGNWVTVLHQSTVSSANPEQRSLNITAQAAGASNVQIRFHYWNGSFEWWWQVDNVKVTITEPGPCNQFVCPAPPGSAKPVPDGAFGTAMRGSRVDAAGTQLNVTWDVSTCTSTQYHILYGSLATVASYAIDGSRCGIGTSGSYGWTGVPSGDLWFIVAADDGTSAEGSWGTGVGGAQRNGTNPSGQCGMSIRDNSGSCP